MPHNSFVLLVLLLIVSCAPQKKPSEKVENIIDQSYTESTSFRSFQERYQQEQKERGRLRDFLTYFVDTHQRSAKHLTLPVTFDNESLKEIIKGEREKNPYGLNTYYTIGNVQLPSFSIFLFLRKSLSVYQNDILLGATIREGKALDIKPLASFRNNLVEDMKTRFSISSDRNISLQIEHVISYPKTQKIESVYKYHVNKDGLILVGDDIFGLDRLIIDELRYNFTF